MTDFKVKVNGNTTSFKRTMKEFGIPIKQINGSDFIASFAPRTSLTEASDLFPSAKWSKKSPTKSSCGCSK